MSILDPKSATEAASDVGVNPSGNKWRARPPVAISDESQAKLPVKLSSAPCRDSPRDGTPPIPRAMAAQNGHDGHVFLGSAGATITSFVSKGSHTSRGKAKPHTPFFVSRKRCLRLLAHLGVRARMISYARGFVCSKNAKRTRIPSYCLSYILCRTSETGGSGRPDMRYISSL